MTALDIDKTIARLKAGHLEAVLRPVKAKGDKPAKPEQIVPLQAGHINTLVRATLTAAPGHKLIVWDFSQVEARALAWAACDHDALAIFALYDSGDHDNGDPYAAMAAQIFGGKPGDFIKGSPGEYPGRHIGKQAELGCGYGMGEKKFYQKVIDDGGNWADIIAAAGVDLEPKEMAAVVVEAWRKKHAPIKSFWYELQAAAVDVTEGGAGSSASAGPFTWHNVDGLVLCELPSGRCICYRGMRCDPDEYDRPSLSYVGRKGRERTYGGKLTENVIQAMCRDLLGEVIIKAEACGLPICHTIHDEPIGEAPEDVAEDAHALMGEILTTVPAWAAGMPIAAEGLPLSFRYGK